MKIDPKTKILIVGLGLIGGSYAWALSERGYEVGGIDIDPDSVNYAAEKGWIKHGRTDNDADYIGQFDVIIFALYPRIFMKWIKENQNSIKKNALLTDTTGVKRCFIYELQAELREDLQFIAAHPMAGREKSGIQFADKNIFKNANYIITPTEKNTEDAIGFCAELGREMGFKCITELTPEKHDEMIGFLSQLTHVIAVSLMTCRDSESFTSYTGDSFRDLTRIAKINDEMWSELFLLNKDELVDQMDCFEAQFKKMREYIANGNVAGMREIMRNSTKQREKFDIQRG